MTTPLHGPDAVRRALERRDLIYGLTVDYVMAVFTVAMEERDAEIERLKALAGISSQTVTRTLRSGKLSKRTESRARPLTRGIAASP